MRKNVNFHCLYHIFNINLYNLYDQNVLFLEYNCLKLQIITITNEANSKILHEKINNFYMKPIEKRTGVLNLRMYRELVFNNFRKSKPDEVTQPM